MQIRRIPATGINPAPYNPRLDLQPSDPEYAKLQRSIDEFGCVEPLVWNKRTGHLVGGHQRFKILIARGDTQLDVSVVDLPLGREKALNIALNKISGDWDQDKLGRLLEEITRTPDLDVTLTGFDLPETQSIIAQMLAGPAADIPESFDVAAQLEAAKRGPAVTKPGDLILLGRDPRLQHRLLCGDSTDPEQLKRLMGKERAALFATDPPYLVNYTGTNHPGTRASANKDWSGTYCTQESSWDDPKRNAELYTRFTATAVAHAIRPDAPWYCWHASRNQGLVEDAFTQAGALVHQQIIWAKSRGVLTRSWYLWQHEPCLMGWLKGKKPRKLGAGKDRSAKPPMLPSVWRVDGLNAGPERPDHPTPKPLELFEIPMLQHTRAGEVCYEPFAGSGTQIIAAQRLGRRCFALELSPVYCDVIVRRFIAAAGEAAVDPKLARRYRLKQGAAA